MQTTHIKNGKQNGKHISIQRVAAEVNKYKRRCQIPHLFSA